MKIKNLLLLLCIFSPMLNCNLCASNYCDRIAEIKIMPFKNEKVDDKIYNDLIFKGKEAIPCLVDKITDTTLMEDPRKAPPYKYLTVGDVAFFLLLDITKEPLETFLPEDIKDDFKKEGVYAYFKFVEDSKNRKLIQEKWRNWLRNGISGKNVGSHIK